MLNFSILTAGNIAQKMAATVSQMPEVSCYAIASRDAQRAEQLAQKYGFQKWYQEYESLFTDPAVDIVYIGSPHSHHYFHIKQALLAKKHVLCEKPMTVNQTQAKELFELAKQQGVLLTEATWTRFMPFVTELKKLLQQEAIGKIHSLQCSFGFPVSDRPRMAQPRLAGGALLDLGIYPLTMATILFPQEIQQITSLCTKTSLGVDAHNSIILQFVDGAVASLQSNMLCTLENKAVVYGEKGQIEIPQFWQAQEFHVLLDNGSRQSYHFPHKISGYEYEVEQFCSAIQQGLSECPAMPAHDTLKILGIMDTLRKQWDLQHPF